MIDQVQGGQDAVEKTGVAVPDPHPDDALDHAGERPRQDHQRDEQRPTTELALQRHRHHHTEDGGENNADEHVQPCVAEARRDRRVLEQLDEVVEAREPYGRIEQVDPEERLPQRERRRNDGQQDHEEGEWGDEYVGQEPAAAVESHASLPREHAAREGVARPLPGRRLPVRGTNCHVPEPRCRGFLAINSSSGLPRRPSP